jgi:hypothetical protein
MALSLAVRVRTKRERTLLELAEIRHHSTATITLEALITAKASLPSFSSKLSTELFVITDTICTPPDISIVTSELIAPRKILTTFPFNTFLALSFIIHLSFANGLLQYALI